MLVHPKGGSQSLGEVFKGWTRPLPTTAHQPPKLLLPQCCELSHNQALLTAHLNTPPPPSAHLLPYKQAFGQFLHL